MHEKIKILLVTGSLNIGGMETVAMNIARYSNKDIFTVDFLVYGDNEYANEKEALELGCKIYRVPFPHSTPLTFEKNVRKILRDNGPYQIVHCHNLFNCGFVARAAFKEKVPVRISHSHTNRLIKNKSIVRNIYEWYMRKLINKYSTNYFACSKKAGKYLFGNTFLEEGYVLQNGIDIDKFKLNSIIRQKYRKKYNLNNNVMVIGQVGTLCDVKNHLFSLNVFKKLLEKSNEKYKLVFVGDGELRDLIKQRIKDLNLTRDVIMLGRRNDVPALLSMFDLYFMPSKYEGVSVALMEAQTAGLPCVVSDTACAPEVKVTNQIEILKLDQEIESWALAIERVVTTGRYINAAYKIKEKGYDIKSIIKNLNKKYIEEYNFRRNS